MTNKLALPILGLLSAIALSRPTVSSLPVLGEVRSRCTITNVGGLANSLQVCKQSDAKIVLLPITSAGDFGTVPADLAENFNLFFDNNRKDAVYKAMGVELELNF